MSIRSVSRPCAAALSAALVLFSAPVGAAKEPLPYDVRTRVVYGTPIGPESLRRELQLAIVRALESKRCVAEISGVRDDERPEGDLLLNVTLDAFEDRMRYDSSIAQRTSPNAIPQEEQTKVTAHLSVNVFLDLRTLPDGRPVRSERFHVDKGFRPRINEDPRFEAQLLVVEAVARNASRFLCRGSPKKLAREIEAAAFGDR